MTVYVVTKEMRVVWTAQAWAAWGAKGAWAAPVVVAE
jgi:hypothetical protein